MTRQLDNKLDYRLGPDFIVMGAPRPARPRCMRR